MRYREGFANVRFKFKVLGGELGGSTVTVGDITSEETDPIAEGRCRLAEGALVAKTSETGGLRLGWPDAPAEERVGLVALNSWGFGFGEMGLGGGTTATFGVVLAICSKWERRDDTGFW